MSKSAILVAMVFALCVARLATVPLGPGAQQMMQAEGFAQAMLVAGAANA